MLQKQRIKKTIIFIIVISQLILLSSCIYANTGLRSADNNDGLELTGLMSENKGNTMSNLRNGGYIANDNYYIFYITAIGLEATLNKRSIADGESRIIGTGEFLYLNVVDGFIYYVDDNKIYRMDINGENRERLSETMVRFLIVYDNTIFALGGNFEWRGYGRTDSFAMNIDGTDVRSLSDNRIGSIYFYDSKIYYTTRIDGQTLLYRMDLNGENRELLFQGNMEGHIFVHGISEFFVHKGNIFYIELRIEGGALMKLDTYIQEFLEVHYIESDIVGLNRKDNSLFYTTFDMGRSLNLFTFHRIDLDTGEIYYTRGIGTIALHVIRGRLFFYDSGRLERVYTMNIDGSDMERFH